MRKVELLTPSIDSLRNKQDQEVSERKLPSSVDFMLLGTCELRCAFCYGPQHEIGAMDTETVKSVLQNLSVNGVERVVFTGGEPTLIRDLDEILYEAKSQNLTTVLSSNGLRLARNRNLLDRIAPYLDWIGLPLDGDTPQANALMRVGLGQNAEERHFFSVISLIQRIQTEYPELKIKLGTVVAKPNLDHVEDIPFTLAKFDTIPDTWKLYQVSPSEYGKLNYKGLRVGDDEFEQVFHKSLRNAEAVGIPNVTKYSNATRPGKYLFIDPAGEALIVSQQNNDYHSIGNFVRNPEDVITNWRGFVDSGLLVQNFEDTYPKPKTRRSKSS